MTKQRERFEAWAVAPPREWPIEKQPNSPSSAWPGQYVAHYVQCAWEAWQAALPWTNVEDGLPYNIDSVIANDGHDSYCAAYAGRWLDLEVTDRDGDYWPLDNVKRWMPLPE